MKTMKALRFDAFGPPSNLSLQDVEVPQLKAGEVLIRVHAGAINPSDVKNLAGLFNAALPRVPGRDFAGTVAEGDGVKGQEVWGSGAGFGMVRDGAHAQYVVLPADWVSIKPANLSMEQAAAVGAPYVAAWCGLVRAGDLRPSETILITGALGAVGRAATQIAHWKKARVIGADITTAVSEVDTFIDMREKDLSSQVKALTDGKGVSLSLDAVGGAVFEQSLKSLGLDGRQVAITSVGSRRVEFDLVDFYRNRLRLVGVDTAKLTGGEIAQIMNELRVGFEEGHLKPPAVRTWPLERAVEAYSAVADGDAAAKHVLIPQP
jgi:NADPH2:quinone reductase